MIIGKIRNNISLKDDIYTKVDDAQILGYYLNINKFPILINSPFRVDRNPSFSLFPSRDNKIRYKDLSTGESGDAIDLLCKLWSVNFDDCINRIYNDMSNFSSNISVKYNKVNHNTKKSNSNITESDLKCKVRKWESFDLEYWEKYGISLKWLKFGEIYPISHIILESKSDKFIFPADKLAYAYVERKDNEVTLKIYQPKNKKYKWYNKHDSSVWDLWTKLPEKGDNLIITSSRKDALCIWENTLIPAVSLQAESYLPKVQVVEELKNRFKNVYILYDNDFNSDINHGEELGKNIAEEFDLIFIQIPTKLQSKDTSDLCLKYGRSMVKKVIYKLINI